MKLETEFCVPNIQWWNRRHVIVAYSLLPKEKTLEEKSLKQFWNPDRQTPLVFKAWESYCLVPHSALSTNSSALLSRLCPKNYFSSILKGSTCLPLSNFISLLAACKIFAVSEIYFEIYSSLLIQAGNVSAGINPQEAFGSSVYAGWQCLCWHKFSRGFWISCVCHSVC